jgi:hypothetical protein
VAKHTMNVHVLRLMSAEEELAVRNYLSLCETYRQGEAREPRAPRKPVDRALEAMDAGLERTLKSVHPALRKAYDEGRITLSQLMASKVRKGVDPVKWLETCEHANRKRHSG